MFWSGEHWRIFATTLFDQWAAETFAGMPRSVEITDFAMANIRKAGAVLDGQLAKRPFIVGEKLTLADIDIAGPFSQNHCTGAPLNEFPKLVAWQQRLHDMVPAGSDTRDEIETRFGSLGAYAGKPGDWDHEHGTLLDMQKPFRLTLNTRKPPTVRIATPSGDGSR